MFSRPAQHCSKERDVPECRNGSPEILELICPGEVLPNEQETDTHQLPAGQVVDLGCGETGVQMSSSLTCVLRRPHQQGCG